MLRADRVLMQLSDTNLKGTLLTGGKNYRQYFVLFSILILSVCMYGIYSIVGFSYYPDEFGYWSSAAVNIGYDWSEVASLGSYYSFGYSLILTPILYFFRGGLAAYRAAVVVNMLLHVGSVWLLGGIARRLCPKAKNMDIVYAVGIAVFYPVWIFFVQGTLAEALIAFLYVLICYFFALILEKPRVITVIALVISLVYICCVHMRTISIVIAAFIILMLWAWNTPAYRKFILIILGIGAAGVTAIVIIKALVTANVYGEADQAKLAGNTFAGQIYTFKYLFTLEGMLGIIQGIAGKIYYLGMASFGLFYVAIYYLGRKFVLLLRGIFLEKRKIQSQELLCSFLFLSMLGQFAVTALYMNKVSGPHEIFYGRYNEYILPVFMMVAVLIVSQDGRCIKRLAVSAIISVITCTVGTLYAQRLGMVNMHSYFVAGISYIWDSNSFDLSMDLWTSLIVGLEFMCIVFACLYGYKIKGLGQYLLNFVIAGEIVLGLLLCTNNTYVSSRVDRNDLQVFRYIDSEENMEVPVQYLAENDHTFIDLIQFYMEDRKIDVIYDESEIIPGSLLIIDVESPSLDSIKERYELCKETAWFNLFRTD